MSQPITFTWLGDCMVPLPKLGNVAAAQFSYGKRYTLTEFEERSMRSHRHYFARLHDLWQSLPEHIAPRFPTDEHLRKWSLIKCGYVKITPIVAANNDEAMKAAAWARQIDPYVVVRIDDNVATLYTARSQKLKRGDNGGMDAKEFQQSKTAVLEFLEDMIGVESEAA